MNLRYGCHILMRPLTQTCNEYKFLLTVLEITVKRPFIE